MSATKNRFDPHGEFAASIARYCIQKAQEALGQGVNASEGDYSWESFRKESSSLAKTIADKHPGGQADHYRLARNNYNKQAAKFVDWLASGRGKEVVVLMSNGTFISHIYRLSESFFAESWTDRIWSWWI